MTVSRLVYLELKDSSVAIQSDSVRSPLRLRIEVASGHMEDAPERRRRPDTEVTASIGPMRCPQSGRASQCRAAGDNGNEWTSFGEDDNELRNVWP